MWCVGCSDKTIQIFKKLEAKRLENEMSGIINLSFDGLTYNVGRHFHFPFSTSTSSSSKIPSNVPLLNFEYSPLFTFQELKKVELDKNDFEKAQIVTHYSYWTLFLRKWKHIFSWLISVWIPNECGAYLHLLLLLLMVNVPLWWTLFKPFLLNIILTHVCLLLSI